LCAGIDYAHPDLAANMWTNVLDPIDGVDNDENGVVDDYYGANAITALGEPMSGDPNDDEGHGTHCAGMIGAVENGIHVVGVSPQVRYTLPHCGDPII
jgi:subtilisin family serine protease